MKLLYFGDFHERQKAPASRIDDWSKTIHEKVDEIKTIAKDNNVLALLQPGDFLDTPKVSDEFLYEIISRWSDLDLNHLVLQVMSGELTPEDLYEEIKKNKPMIGIVGNHELFGHSMKAFNKTSLSLLNQLGFMNLVTKDNPILLKSDDGLTVAITGSNYHADIDRDKSHKDYIVEQKLGDFHIHLVHGYGTTHDFGELIPHTKISELGATHADLTIMGHDHIGFDPIEVNGKWFVNPGAPVRLSNDEKEMNRIPKVMLIEVEKQGHSIKMIPLTTAQDSSVVLDRSKIETKNKQQEKLDDIKETIKSANVAKGDNIVEIIEHIAENKNIGDEIKADVRELISKKAEVLSTCKKSPQPYHIKKLVLENFQSHEYSEFEFSDGLNVFTGESRSGKTSVIRALGWIYEDYGGASRRFIKTGAKSAAATIYLSNGYIVTRTVDAKASGFNGYKVFHPSTNEWESMNTKAIDVVQEILGFSRLQVDKTDSGKVDTIPLNFLRQGNSWFFIGDDTSGSQRAKIIGTICGTNIADAAIREVEAKNKEYALLLKNVEKELIRLDIEAGCMTHVEKMEDDISYIEKLLEEIDSLVEQKTMLEENKEAIESIKSHAANLKIIESDLKEASNARQTLSEMTEINNNRLSVIEYQRQITTHTRNSEKLSTIISQLATTKEAQEKLHELAESVNSRIAITKLAADLQMVIRTGKHLKKFSNGIPDTAKAHDIISTLKELNETKRTIASSRTDVRHNTSQQENLCKLVVNLASVETAKKEIQNIFSLIEQKRVLEEMKRQVTLLDKDIATQETHIAENSKKIKTVKLEYMDVFSHVTECPLCLHEITRDDAIAIAKNKFQKEN